MKEIEDKIVVFGHYDWRFDTVRKSKIIAAGRNCVILGMDYKDVLQYRIDSEALLPAGEPIDKLASPSEA